MRSNLLWISASLLLVVGLGAPRVRARKPDVRHKLRKTLTLKFTTKKPSFYSQRYGELMDRGRLFYLGRGLWFEGSWFYMLRLHDMKRIVVRAPVQRFLLANRHIFPRAGSGRKLPAYAVKRLLFYDSTQGVAGILLDDRMYRKGGRVLYLHWNLRKRRITRAVVLAANSRRVHWTAVKPIAYHPKRRTLYLQLLTKFHGGYRGRQPYRVRVLALSAAGTRSVTSFRARYPFSRGPFYDKARDRVLLTEYAEKGKRPSGYLVHLKTGKRRKIALPVVTYGVAFSSDGKQIFAYGAQRGKLWSIDARSGRRLKSVRVGALGHAAGMIFKDTLLVVRNKGLYFIDTTSLKTWKVVPTRTWNRGFTHVQGTLVASGRVFLRTSDVLRVIDFQKK